MKWRDLLGNIRANFRCVQNYSMDSGDRYCFKPKLQWNPQVKDYFIKAYGAEHFDRICEVLTHPSCYSCIRVNALKSTSDAVIQKLMAFLHEKKSKSVIDCKNRSIGTRELGTNTKQGSSSEESNFNLLSDLCSGTALELPGDGDAPSVSLQCPPIYKLQVPGIDYVVIVKGSGPHTIDYCAVPSQPPKELIVSRKCAEAVLRGAQVYVPGVMACSSHVDEGNTVAVSVAVEQPCLGGGWGVGITRGTVLQGLQTDPHYFERHGLYIGQGKARMSRAGIFRASEGIAVDMTNRVFQLPSFYGILEGEIFLQNLPSIITAHVLDPQQGERILDMCAAPGGKTTAIAILMKDRGEIIAVDRSHNKVMDIHKLAAEMGLTCITAYKLDALKSVCRKDESCDIDLPNCTEKTFDISCNSFSTSSILKTDIATSNGELHGVDLKHEDTVSSKKENRSMYQSQVDARKNIRRRNGPGRNHCMGGRVEKSRGFSPNTFDRVLLDAPCSALGLRPRLFAGEETLDSLRNHGKYQRKMFDQAVQLVRPGGVIVYSTCTINPGENEALVRYALDTYKFLSLAPQHPRIGGPGLVGRCELFGGKYVEEWLREGEEELVQRFDPSSPLDTIGFFIAKFSVGQKET